MATLRERVLDLLAERGPLTDRDLRELAGARSHQHVNQVCRRLHAAGELDRRRDDDGRIRNVLSSTPRQRMGPPERSRSRQAQDYSTSLVVPPLDQSGVLVVLPCSARKQTSPPRGTGLGGGVMNELPATVARELDASRQRVAPLAGMHGGPRVPALDRYDGSLYRQLERSRLRAARCSTVILSGGYGLLDVDEPIEDYDRQLHHQDWPDRLLERALVAVAAHRDAHTVVAFLASTTAYARIVRNAPWEQTDARVLLVTVASGGSTRRTPAALGTALMTGVDAPWGGALQSPDGETELRVEAIRRAQHARPEQAREALDGLTDETRRRGPSELDTAHQQWQRPGLYAWWADAEARRLVSKMLRIGEVPQLIYAGQTGATSWPSGRHSRTTLGQRIFRNHLHGNIGSSTFRRTLAALLQQRGAGSLDEKHLTAWMERHLTLTVWPFDDRDRLDDLEEQALDDLDPPLNLDKRPRTDARRRLTALRRQVSAS